MRTLARQLLALLLVTSLGFVHGGAFAQSRPAYTQPELDRMLAPVALYPDALLSQILMASTYPLEVAEAARWSRSNPGLDGDNAVRAVADRDWDPSVKSLVAFPQVLARMDENPGWTQDLGDAFLGQEPQVMDTVQSLRRKAQAAGTLRSDERIRVAPSGPTLVIQPAQPQVIYVPYYDPWVAYGPWWWPSHPPVYWAPWPGYYVHRYHYHPQRPGVHVGLSWGTGIGLSVGFFFGAVDWHHRQVRVVQVDNYYYRRPVVVNNVRVTNVNVAPGAWRHEPAHRRGIAYRDAAVQNRFARAEVVGSEQRVEQREQREEVLRRENRPAATAVPVTRPAAQPAVIGPAAQPATVAPAARPNTQTQERRDERRERREDARQAETRQAAPAAPVARPPTQPATVAPAAQPGVVPPAVRPNAQAQERRDERRVERHQEANPVERRSAVTPAPMSARPAPQVSVVAAPRVDVQRQQAQPRAEPARPAAPAAQREQRREAREERGARQPAVDARVQGRVDLR